MGILVNTGFDVGSSNPIDSRTVKETTNERDALVTDGLVYENLKVYCKDTQTEYRWTGTDWEIVEGIGGDLTDYQEKTDNTLDTTDKTITGAINEVNGNLLDTVGFSADYKNIILNRKSGLNPYTIPITAIIHNASLTELKDIDSTDIGNGKTLIYDAATQKHKYVGSTGTDELVKMDSTGDAHYLADLIDKQTVINDNGILKVKKLDGQEVTITEINYLKGLTMNVMDLVSAFANGGVKVLNTPLNTASELDTMDRTSFIEGISYIVYVLADETHAGAKTTYLVDKDNTTFFGNADSQRNFTTNPIDLANEVTGKLGTSNIDVDSLWSLLTINDTYKTLTTNNEIFGTHGAKAMYDELTTAIGKKANTSDIPTKVSELTNDSNYVTEETVNAELNNKVNRTELAHIKRFTSVPGNDWNNAVEEGYYSIQFDSVANTIENRPFNYAIQMRVIKADANDPNYVYQIAYVCSQDSGIYIRKQKGDSIWTPWQELATMDKLGDNDTRVTTLETQVSELFQSVSNGKSLVANAITGKGVSTSSTATFATMATNIGKINSRKEETKSYNISSSDITPLTITFSANILGVKQVIPPTNGSRIINKSSDMFTINGKELILYVSGIGKWKVTALIQA